MFYPKLKILKKSRLYTIYYSGREFVMYTSSGDFLVNPDSDPLEDYGNPTGSFV